MSVPHERFLNRTCRREPFNKTLYLEATIISTGQNNLAVSINIPLDIGNLATVKVTMHLQIDNFLQIWIFESKYWSKCDLLFKKKNIEKD